MTTLDALRTALADSYQVEREIGQGGMARVYLARDLKHDRMVALKVVETDSGVTFAAERFVREIRLCARLSHPHILPLLDSGQADDRPFFVMPYVTGDSVRHRLDREQRLPVEEAVTLAREIADALDYAHAAGVIHRDIKPENVLLHGGHAVVLDFGVGRATSAASDAASDATPDLTLAGLVVGTPAYMSPEQAAGEAVIDSRSDQYALAVMLFEMLTGRGPFEATSTSALIAKRFTETPPAASTLRPDIPAHVSDAIARALSLEPDARFRTAGEFARALAAPGATTTMSTPATARLADPPSIAVVPFANLGGQAENEFLADGLTDEVIGALSRLRALRVAARTSSYAIRNLGGDAATVAERLKVAHLLEGSVQRAGNRIRVKARLVSAADGFQLWAEQFDRELDDVFAIQDAISAAIVGALKATILADIGVAGAPATPTNAAAYEKYLAGRFEWNKRTPAAFARAVDLFAAAIAADPAYAPAYAGLADTYTILGIYGLRDARDVMPLARENAARALALDPSLADPHAALGCVAALYDHDWAAAETAFERAVTLEPSHVSARQFRAAALLVPLRRFDEAIREADRARALDPLSAPAGVTAGVARGYAGDYDGAAAVCRELLAANPAFGMAAFFLGTNLIGLDRAAEARDAFEQAASLVGDSPEIFAWLAYAHALAGDPDTALRQLARLEARRASQYVSPVRLAQVNAALGDRAGAFRWLAVAEEERDASLVYVTDRRAFAPVIGEPEFAALVRRLGLPATTA